MNLKIFVLKVIFYDGLGDVQPHCGYCSIVACNGGFYGAAHRRGCSMGRSTGSVKICAEVLSRWNFAEHNTTTDEIVLFDSEVPASHREKLHRLQDDLRKAQQTATCEGLGGSEKNVQILHSKANHWAETGPEWGLAKNAGFMIGPRTMTKNLDLAGNCFLHSYEWQTDKSGKALEPIMQGPMVVTQWINNHYYFSTVDNHQFGGGSKITHNITGRFGVVQGNGGDLKIGLPLQSVNSSDEKLYHKPLRLSVIIQAPKERIAQVLRQNANHKMFLDNQWIYLIALDPNNNNIAERYEKDINWKAVNEVNDFAAVFTIS